MGGNIARERDEKCINNLAAKSEKKNSLGKPGLRWIEWILERC